MIKRLIFVLIIFVLAHCTIKAQQITGNWHGKVGTGIKTKKLELKLVLKGDSIVGTSYYYESKQNYKRYSVKGYFNPKTNAVIWWDDVLLESKEPKVRLMAINELPYLIEADFNCPGGGVMMLDGKAADANKPNKKETIHLDKKENTLFDDEWNLIIDNWLIGSNNLILIDSVQNIAFNNPIYEKSTPVVNLNTIYKKDTIANTIVTSLDVPVTKIEPKKAPIEFLNLSKPKKAAAEIVEISQKSNLDTFTKINDIDTLERQVVVVAPNEKPIPIVFENINKPKKTITVSPNVEKPIEEKFVERKKIVLAEIPIADSITLYFYDNAEVDGDSISLFLDDKLLLEHIRLSDQPYIVTLNKELLANATSLTMVAENLGSIPPNTSYVKTTIKGKKYDATLSSTEQTSAVIKFKKE